MRLITIILSFLTEREATYCPYCGTDPCSGLTENCSG